MNELAESVSLKKLSVLTTIGETLEVCWQHRKVLVLWIVGCTIFTGGLCYLIEHIIFHFIWVFANWKPLWFRIAFLFLSVFPTLMISTLFSIFCHRLILTDGKNESLYPITFGKREWRFFGWDLFFCAAAILFIIFGIIFQEILLVFLRDFEDIWGILVFSKPFWEKVFETYFVNLIYWVLGSYLLARYCLVLPATAVDLKPSLAWSSEQTKGNELRLALLFGGLPFIFGFLYCPPSLLTWLQIDQWMIVKHVIRPFLVYLVTPIIVIAISIAFRELTNWTPSSQLIEST